MAILAIETSCDDTAAAVVGAGPVVLSQVLSSQASIHNQFGGVVPEQASREHIARLSMVVEQALQQVDGPCCLEGVAVTRGPGLLGPLLVGLQFAKGFALARNLPWLGIHHLEGHLAAIWLQETPPMPHVALLVSGGHTHLFAVRAFGDYEQLGATRDDAAGEAFDKIAKMLGMPYPGGVAIDHMAQSGDGYRFDLPQALLHQGLDMSFSGLKTAAQRLILAHDGMEDPTLRADFCASVQRAIAQVLVEKTMVAVKQTCAQAVVLGGGVAANSGLRQSMEQACSQAGIGLLVPPPSLCTDNAAMIGAAGWLRMRHGERSSWQDSALSRWSLPSLQVPRGASCFPVADTSALDDSPPSTRDVPGLTSWG